MEQVPCRWKAKLNYMLVLHAATGSISQYGCSGIGGCAGQPIGETVFRVES